MAKSRTNTDDGQPSYGDLFTAKTKYRALARGFKRELEAERKAHAATKADAAEKLKTVTAERDELKAAPKPEPAETPSADDQAGETAAGSSGVSAPEKSALDPGQTKSGSWRI